MPSALDHIVVVAPDLAVGTAFVSQALGVELEPGGIHPRMATHNLLLRLGEETYLEVIAPDPTAAPPTRPRWFALDDLRPDTPPLLATWVVRTADIHRASRSCGMVLGQVEALSRDNLSWLITVPADGSLPYDGAAPALIEWQAASHPARSLKDQGCTLVRLEVFHPHPEQIISLLEAIDLTTPVDVKGLPPGNRPYLVANLLTPGGERMLSSSRSCAVGLVG